MLYALLFLILRLPSLFEPYWYGDEGIYLTLGQGIRHALLLYQQIHDNKPPTLYYLAAFAQSVFGFRLLLALVMIPTIYFFNRLAKKFLSPKLSRLSTLLFLLLTSIPLIEGNIANAEVFMLLPTILAVYLFLYPLKSKILSLILSGLLLGFAFTIKVPVAVEFAFLCLWLLIFQKSKIKNLLIFSFSFITPIFLYTIYFALKGAFMPFLSAALLQNFGYLSSWAVGTHQASATSGGLLWRALIMFLSWLLFYFFYRKKYLTKDSLFLLSWFTATLFAALLSGRPYPHYLIEVLPPLCLLIFFFRQNIKISLIVIAFFIYSLVHFKFYFYPVFSYYNNFYSYALGKKTLTAYRAYFGVEMNDIYQISDKIKSLTNSSDRIFVWGDQSFIYPLSDRLPATKYLVAYHVVDFQAYNFTLSQLQAQTPKLIIYYPEPSRPYPALDKFISNYYYLVDQIGQAYIFELRPQL
ncbi:MAG: glycosyltransferase family 39 protein [Candidatus Shapirobacteria bacterium]|jgi:hypothetical protein